MIEPIPAVPQTTRSLSLPVAFFVALRPKQWTKNGLVFAGLFFTLQQHHPPADFARAALAFAIFCLLSGAVYLVNDVLDADADRRHPTKRLRPIASGALAPRTALAFAVLLLALGFVPAGALLGARFLAAVVLYTVLSFAYTLHLKHVVLIDVMVLASGYVLRAAAGCFAVGVPNSPWLLLCTTLLALFLGLAKRRGELAALGDNPATRRILADYSLPMLDQMITIVAASCVMAYALYTFFSRPGTGTEGALGGGMTALLPPSGRPYLMVTIPFVIYGLFRYLYLVHRKNEGEAPETVLLKDRPTLLNVLLYIATALAVILGTR